MTGAMRDTTRIKATEQQLRHHIDALQKTNAELDQFVYSTSHNLRSPLASILGLVSILQGETDHAEQAHYLQLIETSVHRLDSTISSIIDYSRNTRVEVVAEPINFQGIIAEIIDSLYFLLHAVNVRVTTRLPDTISFATHAHRLKSDYQQLAVQFHQILQSPGSATVGGYLSECHRRGSSNPYRR